MYNGDDALRLLTKLAVEIDRRTSDRQDKCLWLGYLFFVAPTIDDVFPLASTRLGGEHSDNRLQKILLIGPRVGIHTLVWCDAAELQHQPLDADRVRAFRYRLLGRSVSDQTFRLSPWSASTGAVDPEAMALDDRDQSTTPTMFYPYRTPTADWLEQVISGWRSRSNGDGK